MATTQDRHRNPKITVRFPYSNATMCLDFIEEYRKSHDLENQNQAVIAMIDELRCKTEPIKNTQELIDVDDNRDFDSFACQFRKPHDGTAFVCFSRNPLVRVLKDGMVPKDICRLCQRLQTEQRFLNGVILTSSGENYRQYLIRKRQEERLDFLKRKERIKTEAQEERRRLREQNQRRTQVDWGNSTGIDLCEYSLE